MGAKQVVVVGAGVAGLVAAVDLATRGLAVTVLERQGAPGGKMRELHVDGAAIDAGPTVFTLRRVFEDVFASAGASLTDHVTLHPVDVLARHAWGPDQRLDLFADIERSADAIGVFAGAAEARGYRVFCARAQRVFETLDHTFIRAARPTLMGLVGSAPVGALFGISPFATLWGALGEHFRDPRLRQLFGRYATYCGSSPFLAPATLMLIAHVERDGVWLIEGGMHRLAQALARLAEARGALFRFGADVAEVLSAQGKATGVMLACGERIEADAVVVNADVPAVSAGRFGRDAARAAPDAGAARSLSAVTWTMHAATAGFPLLRHNVFFSGDYPAEFSDIFRRNRLPASPTVYVCAQDRADTDGAAPPAGERLLCLVNAPPIGDTHPFPATEIDTCATETFGLLERCGLRISRRPETTVVTTPVDWNRLYPGTGGALYGPAMHSPMAAFRRPGSRTRMPGLYLAGGSTHPGSGVPMAALSGRLAAASLLADLDSTSSSARTATRGGTSMR